MSVDAIDLTIPTQVAKLRITAGTDPTTPEYTSQDLPLCAPGQSAACYALPLTTTLVPGDHDRDATVRVQVDALDSTGTTVTSDAASFVFSSGAVQHLDFFLSNACLATSCATSNLSCRSGACVQTNATTTISVPDLATESRLPISRLSFVQQLLPSTDPSLAIPPPRTQAGDLVLLGIAADGNSVGQPPPGALGSWTSLGQGDGLSALFARISTGDEATEASALTFTKLQYDVASILAVDRGASRFAAGVNHDVDDGRFSLAPTAVDDGSLIVGVAITQLRDLACSATTLVDDVESQENWILFDEGPLGEGISPEGLLTCGTDTTEGTVFEVVLSP